MSKDVILDKYARLYEIPNQLALLGHQVECFCLSYQTHDEGIWDESNIYKQLIWHSKSYQAIRKVGIFGYPLLLLKKLQQYQPDIIIAASDIPHIIFGGWCAKRLNKPFVVDLYDNFEGFGQAKIPFFKALFRRAVRHAQLIMTTSQPLADLVIHDYAVQGEVISLPSTVDLKIFTYGDKSNAQTQFGLIPNKQYIGTAGGLYKDKGVAVIYEAWKQIKNEMPNVHLVLAGPFQPDYPPPEGERVHYLGALPHHEIATLFQALDVGIISILDTPFGRYCFPQKAYEMLACHLPVVVAAIGEMNYLFKDSPQTLFQAGNADDLALKIRQQLQSPQQQHITVEDWATIIQCIEPMLTVLESQH